MFDIGFSELLLIAVVALVVIGPERLPGVARNAGRFAGRLQRYVHDIKRDFNREVEFEEIRRMQQEMETTVQSMQESMRAVETTLKHDVDLQQITQLDKIEADSSVSEEAPALTKPRIRTKGDAKTEASIEPVANPAKPDDEQYRLF